MKIDGVLLKKTEEYRQKHGISVMDERSTVYLGFKLVATISLVWVVATNILIVLSFLYLYFDGNAKGDLQTPITVGILTAVTIIGFIFSMCGKHYVGAPIATVSNAASFLLFMYLQSDVANSYEIGLKESFYYRHAIPLVLLTVCIIAIAYIGIRAKILLKRDAKQVVGKMYVTLKDATPDFSEEIWHEYLEKQGLSARVVDKL